MLKPVIIMHTTSLTSSVPKYRFRMHIYHAKLQFTVAHAWLTYSYFWCNSKYIYCSITLMNQTQKHLIKTPVIHPLYNVCTCCVTMTTTSWQREDTNLWIRGFLLHLSAPCPPACLCIVFIVTSRVSWQYVRQLHEEKLIVWKRKLHSWQ